MSKHVAVPSSEYKEHADDWSLASDLWRGTKIMREAGKRRAPQFPSESDDSYKLRIEGAVLFNAFRRTISMLAGKSFQKPIAVGDDVPGTIKPYLENVDREGTHVDVFARHMFELGVRDGARFIFVDMPQKPANLRLDQERSLLIRPYWCEIDARNLIGWKTVVVGGRRVLSQIRIWEPVKRRDPENEFEEVTVDTVRVVDAPARDLSGGVALEDFTTFRIFEERENATGQKEWVQVDGGVMRPLKEIPLAAFLPRQCGFMQGEMPLLDLAHLNVAHWRSDSDQRYILHKARVPIGTLSGYNAEDLKNGLITVGPDNWLVSQDPAARAGYMEHSGAAIGAGSKDLEELENRMRVMGLELLVEQTGQVTATERTMDQAASDSELASMVRALEDCLENALRFTALWQGVAITDGTSGEVHGGSVTINKDFGLSTRDFQELQWLLTARTAREVSRETFLEELQRRSVVSDEFDAEEEIARLDKEAELNPPFDPTADPNADPNVASRTQKQDTQASDQEQGQAA